MIEVRQFFFGPLHEHCLLAGDENRNAVLVDPGMTTEAERASVTDYLKDNGLTLRAILLTHGHFDHFYSARWCQDTFPGIKVYLHSADFRMIGPSAGDAVKYGLGAADASFTPTAVKDGDILEIGLMKFEVIHTPGHSPGGVCYLERDEHKIFTGDTLFAGTIGRTDFWLGDYDSLIVSIMEKIMPLDGQTVVYPGHGGCTSISYERTHNPFLEPFNEKDPETGAVDGITTEER